MKKLWNKSWNFLFKHESHVYLFLGMVIVFSGLTLWNNTNWANDLLKVEREKAIIGVEVDQQYGLIKDQGEVIDFQSEIIDKYNENSTKSQEVIKMQEQIIRQLIQHLKSLDEWPPDIQPIDPNNITRSEASYEEEISYLR